MATVSNPMEEPKDDFVGRYIIGSRRLAKMLDEKTRLEWYAERLACFNAKERGESYSMSPLAKALDLAVYEHVKDDAELVFPPAAVTLYRRALKALQN